MTMWTWKISDSDYPIYESGFATKQDAINDAYKWFNHYCEFETERGIILQSYSLYEGEPVNVKEEDFTLYGDDDDGEDYTRHMRWECRQENFV